MKKKTSVYENALIWFGAGVSIAEILAGTYFAPLGFQKGLLAIISGHIIGAALMFLAGLIGAKSKKPSMESVKESFGFIGGKYFAVLNVLQLLGWTAIMIYDGADAANGILSTSKWLWCLLIGSLILLWIIVGLTNLGKLNTVAMFALLVLTLVLCKKIFFDGNITVSQTSMEAISFGAALELAVAMPLSWLPLIGDYTSKSDKPVKSTAISVSTYTVVSIWMYLIGMGAALFSGQSTMAQIMLKTGLGIVGLIIVVFSTVTTTFMDAYSGGISTESLAPKAKGKYAAIAITVLGTILAIIFPMDDITDFLYIIGSVFAPMIAIQIADFFILKRDRSGVAVDVRNFIIWLFGFGLYRFLMTLDIPCGNTLPDMLATTLVCIIVGLIIKDKKTKNTEE